MLSAAAIIVQKRHFFFFKYFSLSLFVSFILSTLLHLLQLPLHLAKLSKYYPPLPGIMLEVGSVEVNRDCTVDELKTQILTLSSVSI